MPTVSILSCQIMMDFVDVQMSMKRWLTAVRYDHKKTYYNFDLLYVSATNHSLASFLSLQFVFLLIILELVISIQMMIQRLLHSNHTLNCWFIQDFSRIEDRLHNLDKRSAPPKTASASSLLKHQILSLPSPDGWWWWCWGMKKSLARAGNEWFIRSNMSSSQRNNALARSYLSGPE